jgi:hypothetical protein|tara:strand:+ start:185 stop:484 length:300 start_codon:yes stop_codon:yes gene_type:complete
MNDISIEEINKLLMLKENKIKIMEHTTNKSREKLKQINDTLDKEQKILLNIFSMLQKNEIELMDIHDDYNITEIYSTIKDIQNSLRNTKLALANLIRYN